MKALLVEDNPEKAQTIIDVLEDIGFEVLHVWAFKEFQIAINNAEFDLLVTDNFLPMFSGGRPLGRAFEVFTEYRRRGGESPVIQISGNPTFVDGVKSYVSVRS